MGHEGTGVVESKGSAVKKLEVCALPQQSSLTQGAHALAPCQALVYVCACNSAAGYLRVQWAAPALLPLCQQPHDRRTKPPLAQAHTTCTVRAGPAPTRPVPCCEQVGQRVVLAFNIACGTCGACQREEYTDCETTNDSKLTEASYGHCSCAVFGYRCARTLEAQLWCPSGVRVCSDRLDAHLASASPLVCR
jgi:hypothetical protein